MCQTKSGSFPCVYKTYSYHFKYRTVQNWPITRFLYHQKENRAENVLDTPFLTHFLYNLLTIVGCMVPDTQNHPSVQSPRCWQLWRCPRNLEVVVWSYKVGMICCDCYGIAGARNAARCSLWYMEWQQIERASVAQCIPLSLFFLLFGEFV